MGQFAWTEFKNKVTGVSRERQAAEYVEKNAQRGNPAAVLNAFDEFCYGSNWMMNVGSVGAVF